MRDKVLLERRLSALIKISSIFSLRGGKGEAEEAEAVPEGGLATLTVLLRSGP